MTKRSSFQMALSLHRKGDIRAAASIYEALARDDPKDANALHYLGLAHMQLGNLSVANKLLERSVILDAANANALNDFGLIKAKLGQPEPAIRLFSRALTVCGRHTDALSNIAMALNSLRLPHDALPYLERLSALQPNSAAAISRLAHTRLKIGDTHRAIDGFRQALKLEPQRIQDRILLGEALELAGSFKQAQAQYLSALRRDENNVVALAQLLNLPEGSPDPAQISKAHRLLETVALMDSDRARLQVALGRFYDRRGSYDNAFKCFRAGNELQFAKAPFNSEGYAAAVDRLIAAFSCALLSAIPRHGIDTDRPIFIVGMPRSGTTLLEQILASHPLVAGGGELLTIMRLGSRMHHLGRDCRPYPDGVRDLTASDLARMAREYLEKLDQISSTAARVTDKQPFNFMHLGLVAILFPRATILHCRRDPLDTCLSCYCTSFAEEVQFAHDLQTLGRYYLDYQRLMEHWRKVLPLRIVDVQYEELVRNTESVVREVLNQCGLEWEACCLNFHDTRRYVRTPSRWQVRQPIYPQSIGRWKNYERHLQPLKAILSRLDREDAELT
jgi:tetratricopeptide (TPR) repeat protein